MAEDFVCIAKEEFTPQKHSKECSQKEQPEAVFGLAGGGYGAYTYCPECGAVLTKTLATGE